MTETATDTRTGWWLVQMLAIALGLFGIFSNSLYVWDTFNGTFPEGRLGADLVSAQAGTPLLIVARIYPGEALAQAGVKKGDRIALDRPFDNGRPLQAGEVVGLTVQGARHLTVAASPPPAVEMSSRMRMRCIDSLSALLATLVGVFILLRSRASPALVTLGLAFVSFNYTSGTALQSLPDWYWAWTLPLATIQASTPILFLAFALLFYRENVGPVRPRAWRAWALDALLMAACAVAFYVTKITGVAFLSWALGDTILYVLTGITMLATIALSLLGWLKSTPALRRRYAIMLVAVACFVLSSLIIAGSYSFSGSIGVFGQPVSVQVAFEILATAAPLLFAYAVLRHKVLDIGFVINRALVYGVVSSVLLVGFGLVEWLSEKLLPENLETNALVAGGVALAIFLLFHRLRDAAEHVIEGLFFRTWRDNEAGLRRFVAQAPFFGSPVGLTAACVAELNRFAGGAPAALYLPQPDGGFRREAGNFGPEQIGGDDAVVVALRASRAAVEPDAGPAALALPMNHRGALSGFVLLAPKPSGEGFRPDESEILGWATAQIGHDLHALKVEEMAAQITVLQQERERLAAQVEFARTLGLAVKSS